MGFAVEYEVMSDDSDKADLFGRAISLDGGLLLAGAPKKHRDVPEVQLIVSTGTASEVTFDQISICKNKKGRLVRTHGNGFPQTA